MENYTQDFLTHIGAKSGPNEHEKKLLKRAQKFCKYCSFLPGVRMIAVCNSLSLYATHKDSDIDLFVVTLPRRIWLVRVGMVFLFGLFGVRRRNLNVIKQTQYDLTHEVAGKLCLSFFVTTNSLNLEGIAIQNDVYLYHWMRYLKPIIDINKTYSEFLHANDITLEEVPLDVVTYRVVSKQGRSWDKGWIFDVCNDFLRKVFLPRTHTSFERLGRPFGVVISDDMLKFHDQDKRENIRDTLVKTIT